MTYIECVLIGKVCDLHKVGATVGCVGPPVVCSEHIPGKTLISSRAMSPL